MGGHSPSDTGRMPLRDGILIVGAYRDTPALDCPIKSGDDDSYRRR